MTGKLPVKTFKLRRRKTIGLILFILLELFLGALFAHLCFDLEKPPGKILCIVLSLFSFILAYFCIVALIRLIQDKFTGFFISSDGVNDISTGHNYGVIMWKDVLKIRVVEDSDNPDRRYIMLKVKDPQDYIDREPSSAKKQSMIQKLHYYGSPISFSNRGLKCSFEELENTVNRYYCNYLARQGRLN